MTAPKAALLIVGLSLLALSGCDSGGGSSSGSTSSGGGGTTTPPPVNNTQPIQVSSGPAGNDINTLLTSVTVCEPGTNTCQTISNVLVDSGSVGLRLFGSQVSLSLPRAADAGGSPIGNCVTFADTSYAWGPVATADVHLAGEIASSVPIQLIGGTGLSGVPFSCSTGGAAVDVNTLGANGILGIGLFRQDCGNSCTGASGPPVYFSCPSSGCVAAAVALQQQVQNPVWMFPQDNNGVLISLPAINSGGSQSTSGSLIFGIGTQSNNSLIGVGVYNTNANGNFTTTFGGITETDSFIDSGSNGFFFQTAASLGIPTCTVSKDFYCPASPVAYSAVTTGTNGNAITVAFSIANADSLFNTGNTAFNDIGGPNVGGFDLGLPFFFGRAVYIGIEGQSSGGGTGPYWAY